MAPDTVQVRAELTKRARERAERKGYAFGSDKYMEELKKVDPRGMTPNVVEDIIKTGTRKPGDTPGTWKYVCLRIALLIQLLHHNRTYS